MKWKDFLLELCKKYDIEQSQKEFLRVVKHNINENSIDVKDETMKIIDVFGDTTEIDLKTFVTVQTSNDDSTGKIPTKGNSISKLTWNLDINVFPAKIWIFKFFSLMVFAIKMLLDNTYGLPNLFEFKSKSFQ